MSTDAVPNSSLPSNVLPASLPGRHLCDNIAIIDFETRSFGDLKKLGAWRYAQHPTTEVLCMAYYVTGDKVRLWLPGDPFPAILRRHIEKGGLLEAHNYFFEKCIWVHKLRWPEVKDEQWRCTMSRCFRYNLPKSLDVACRVLGLSEQKSKEGHALMLKMCKPRKPSKDNPAIWHETPEQLERLYEYCRQDVKAELALSRALPPLEPRELAIWQFTEALNWRGVKLDLDFAARAVRIFAKLKEEGHAEITKLTDGRVTTGNQTQRILDFCAQHGTALTNLQKSTVAEVLLDDTIDPKVKRILELRKLLGKGASISKYEAMLNKADLGDGRLRGHVAYFGAGPGRWAGRGVQTQNLPSRDVVPYKDASRFINVVKSLPHPESARLLYSMVSKQLSSSIRPSFTAGPGKTFVCVDFASIEARIMAWLTGDQNLEIFRNNGDIYIKMASKIYEREITKYNKVERALGKEAELACMYQLWWQTLLGRCWKKGVKIEPELAIKTVKMYRKEHPIVTGFWKDIKNAFVECILYGKDTSTNKIGFERTKNDIRMVLPSGRTICYNKPTVKKTKRGPSSIDTLRDDLAQLGAGKELIENLCELHEEEVSGFEPRVKQTPFYWRENSTGKWVQVATYGGKLGENACQGIAGDILSESSLRLDKDHERFGVAVLTVHDELVFEQDIDKANLDDTIEEMCIVPPWARGLPLAGEGWIGRNYRK